MPVDVVKPISFLLTVFYTHNDNILIQKSYYALRTHGFSIAATNSKTMFGCREQFVRQKTGKERLVWI
jgi:hypothetical protein